MTSALNEHWNKIYTNSPITQLGWYEAEPSPSIQLIEKCAISKHDPLIDVGSGTSTLIPRLLELGYQNLIAIDLSEVALGMAKALLGIEQAAKVHWISEDITNPLSALQLQSIAIWHDRAMFHFLTVESQRQMYFSVLQKMLRPGGFVIIAAFAMNGAEKCSGLPVQRYNAESLSEFFGNGFKLLDGLDVSHRMPSGDIRPYVYARFQKIK
jgi:EEF1A lysine methyltransferase 2